jgi:glycosyltransferase involved in cell wall biosynthesis
MTMKSFDVFSLYGRSCAGVRVRVHEWLEHLGLSARIHDYVGRSTAGASVLASHPRSVIRAERELRALSREALGRVLIYREASPLSDGTLEARLLEKASLGVLDLDDAIFWDALRPRHVERVWPKGENVARAFEAADCVIAGNATLAEEAARWTPHVVVIPSCVQPDAYRQKSTYEMNDPPRILWIGSSSTEQYLARIADPLLEIHRRTGARLVLVGDGRRRQPRLEPIIDRVQWSEPWVFSNTADCDIGIMPLTDDLYGRGKCGYKLLQYAAVGLPMVGSAVGINRELLDKFGMPACESDSDWMDALGQLFGQTSQSREASGRRVVDVVRAEYSFAAWANAWRAAVGLT